MAMDAAQRKEYQILLRGVPRFKDDGQTVWPEWRLAFETWMLYSGMSDFPVPGGNEQVKGRSPQICTVRDSVTSQTNKKNPSFFGIIFFTIL